MRVIELYDRLDNKTIIEFIDASGGHYEQLWCGQVNEARKLHINQDYEVLEIRLKASFTYQTSGIVGTPIMEIWL